MSDFLSLKLRFLSLLAILNVIYIHSDLEVEGMPLNTVVQQIISVKLGQCAVPLFFIISGYLFFLKSDGSLQCTIQQQKKRVYSLLIPYFIGSFFYITAGSLVELLPFTAPYITNSYLHYWTQPWTKMLLNLFTINDGRVPIAFHLWFVRDLILIVASAPLLVKIASWNRYVLPVIFLIAALLQITFFPSPPSVFWFLLGGLLVGRTSILTPQPSIWKAAIVAIVFIVGALTQTFVGRTKWLDYTTILLGIVTLSYVYDIIYVTYQQTEVKNPALKWFASTAKLISPYTFFIYLVHMPTIGFMKKGIVKLLGDNSLSYLSAYTLSPIINLVGLAFVGYLLHRTMPKVYKIISGGR